MMKKFLFLVALIGLVLAAVAADKPRVGVLRFTNHTSNAFWWNSNVASELSDMLASELVSTRKFEVLERKELGAVIDEQDLSQSDRVSEKTKVKLKQIKGAQYLIAATVSAYEEDIKGLGGEVSLGPVSVGGKKQKAYIAVDLKVIDTETGEIVDARTIEAEAKGKALGAGLHIKDFSLKGGGYENTPAGKAIRACIVYISEYLACSLVEGKDSKCMKKWDARDEKRRQKTKDSIDID